MADGATERAAHVSWVPERGWPLPPIALFWYSARRGFLESTVPHFVPTRGGFVCVNAAVFGFVETIYGASVQIMDT